MAGTTGDELTEGQEAFARHYFETGNAAESYRRAYDQPPEARDNWIYVEASQMLDHPKVSLRIQQMQDEAAKLSIYTVKAAFDEYEEARQLATDEKNPSAAVAAVSGKVKLFGLDKPSKQEITGKDGQPIKTEEVGQGAAKLAAVLDQIAERSGTSGEPES